MELDLLHTLAVQFVIALALVMGWCLARLIRAQVEQDRRRRGR
jgi:flagellar biogenesis protein FliO